MLLSTARQPVQNTAYRGYRPNVAIVYKNRNNEPLKKNERKSTQWNKKHDDVNMRKKVSKVAASSDYQCSCFSLHSLVLLQAFKF